MKDKFKSPKEINGTNERPYPCYSHSWSAIFHSNLVTSIQFFLSIIDEQARQIEDMSIFSLN